MSSFAADYGRRATAEDLNHYPKSAFVVSYEAEGGRFGRTFYSREQAEDFGDSLVYQGLEPEIWDAKRNRTYLFSITKDQWVER